VEFLAPKYWLTWLGLGLLRLIHLLPYKMQLKIGAIIGDTYRLVSPSRRHIAKTNLILCFPDKTEAEIEALLRKNFQSNGMALIESAMCWWGSDEDILDLVTFEGVDHLENALKEKKGVILITGHMTTMELGAHAMGLLGHTGAMYRPLKNKLMDHVVKKARSKRLNPTFPRDDMRTMISLLKNGKRVWYGFDQNYGLKHSVFVPFFGVPAATITTTSRIARASNASVVPFFPFRHPDGHYRISISRPLENFPSSSNESDTLALNTLLEGAIVSAPDQYLWIHRRFKTRPINQQPVY
jgi:KDO2-lipid IV(A) lauroyltransferase